MEKHRDMPKHNHKNLISIINKDKLDLLCFVKTYKNIEDLKENLEN